MSLMPACEIGLRNAWIFMTMATLSFATTPLSRPNTAGVYRISRHPMYFGVLLIFIGIGIATASWVFLLATMIFLILFSILRRVEERFLLEKYGDVYWEYMIRTPRWIGIPRTRGNR